MGDQGVETGGVGAAGGVPGGGAGSMYAFHHGEPGKTYLNPRNIPSDSCPRDEAAIARMVSTGTTARRKDRL